MVWVGRRRTTSFPPSCLELLVMAKKTVLVSPDGREYTASSVAEVTRLRARGYKTKAAGKPAVKPAEKK